MDPTRGSTAGAPRPRRNTGDRDIGPMEPVELRAASDGVAHTLQEFIDHHGADGRAAYDILGVPEPPGSQEDPEEKQVRHRTSEVLDASDRSGCAPVTPARLSIPASWYGDQ